MGLRHSFEDTSGGRKARPLSLVEQMARLMVHELDPDGTEKRWNDYLEAWSPQPGPQDFLTYRAGDVPEIGFGGARGGGKTDGMAGRWLKHEARYGRHARGIIVRRWFKDLEDTVRRYIEIFCHPSIGATYNAGRSEFVFPSGARLLMRHVRDEVEAQRYRGRSFNFLGIEEAQDWVSLQHVAVMRSSLRSPEGVKVQTVLTFNPGGPGHSVLKERFIDAEPDAIVAEERYTTSKGEERELVVRQFTDPDTKHAYIFVPSFLDDNPLLTENDPDYEDRLREVGPELFKAWRYGRWDIAAGGALYDVWDHDRNTCRPFEIPPTWDVSRALDWGSAKPFAVYWFAESDGETPVPMWGLREVVLPAGSLVAVGEWYGWNGKVNTGCKMTATDVAEGIRQRETENGWRPSWGVADSAIFAVDNDRSIADDFAAAGVEWAPSQKGAGSRAARLEVMRRMLRTAHRGSPTKEGPAPWPEEPCLVFFDTCRHALRTLPGLPRNPKKPDDVDTDAEDHAYDAIGYRLTMSGGVMSGAEPSIGWIGV